MITVSKQRALEKLAALTEQVAELRKEKVDSQPFVKWRKDSLAVARNTFGESSTFFVKLSRIVYSHPSHNVSRKVRQIQFNRGLSEAVKVFGEMADEIREFWPEDDNASKPIDTTPHLAGTKHIEVKDISVRAQPRNLAVGVEVDSYRLAQRLGQGFSAQVWKSTLIRSTPGVDLEAGATVAVKFYSGLVVQGMETLRIQREFAIAQNLTHPNLARVHDLVLSPNRPFHTFMVMEYVPGIPLKKHISENGGLGVFSTLLVARQLFEALYELHSQNAIHRDVKPANIMLANPGSKKYHIKLVDLGIVAMKHEDRFTNISAFMGSKHSAPLEQLTGEDVDETADIYGAGAVLFQCLTGRAMYEKVGPEGAIVKRMLKKPEVLEESSTVPEPLAKFVNRCISVQREDRPPNVEHCLNEISHLFETLKLPESSR